ncbi:helix-turn-helix domain-containing protein [Gluconobacter morbifer]|uniref:Nitrogen assimilation regulatory protein NtrC n=1 Tax=Gluconobacter morbifer G707 TaxID=1088869 RepID=G6XLW3_9PROT|nr:helix-turn-helix domain-containing protein [Gluconobacter morbifer]EHH67368.1 nitrogen assimilation regulatory protein NtrC [Gluconobacter morbifer G707]
MTQMATGQAQAALTDPTCRPVFLYGASRLDRQDVARRLHAHSPRSTCPFVVAALTATPRALRPEALFGGEGKTGWIAQAQGGTLLLDEIDCLCPELQARFITCLHAPETDLRVIAASRHDFTLLMRQGALDVGLHRWLASFDSSQKLGPDRIGAVCRLPGDGTERPRGLARALERPLEDYLESGLENRAGDLHACVIGEVERPLITMVLRRTSGNQLRAAAILGLNRNTLRKKIRELDVTVPKGGDE